MEHAKLAAVEVERAHRHEMKFSKPALSVEQQLDLLTRRGMTLADRAPALHHLQHISYHRLRAYWLCNEALAPTAGDHASKFRQPGFHGRTLCFP
jgi:hypothetical protein